MCVHMYNLFILNKWLKMLVKWRTRENLTISHVLWKQECEKTALVFISSSCSQYSGTLRFVPPGGFTSLLPKGGRLKWVQAPGLAKGDRDMESHCPQINLSAASKGRLPVKAQMPSVQAWETTLVSLKENQKPL